MAFRDGPFQDLRVPLTWTGAAAALLAIAIALMLMFSDRRDAIGPEGYGAVRSEFDLVLEPVSGVLAAPVRWTRNGLDYLGGYFFAVAENRRLKAEIAELEGWRDAAIALRNVNARYEALLRLRTEPPIPMVTARVVADVRGPFSNTRLIDAGTAEGIKVGNPVLSERGVVGRVVGAARGGSRVLLLTDVESRTPVLIDRTNARGILTGDGGPVPRLDYAPAGDAIREGDLILTSGDGGIYPRGLPVGLVAKDLRGGWRVRLFADQASIDYVRILVYDDFRQAIDQAALATGPPPPLTAQERAQVEAAIAGRNPLLALPDAPGGGQAGPAQPATPAAPAQPAAPAAPVRPPAAQPDRPPAAPAPQPRPPAPAPAPEPAPVPPPAALEGLF